MKCEGCGTEEGVMRVVANVDGERHPRWLCSSCAGIRDLGEGDFDIPRGEQDDVEPPEGDWEGGEKDAALDQFIGQMFSGPSARDDEIPDCPSCGTSYASFRGSGRLGCPRCYVAFRRHLLPFLGRFHRQVTHLGKFPVQAAGSASRLGEITRTRIALEKAVAAEDFEEAARLRDRIRDLENPVFEKRPDPEEGNS
jgi:protein arginine kinase activator